MRYLIPGLGVLFVILATAMSIGECRRVLIASNGDLKALRPFGMSWLGALIVLLVATLALKQPALYLALGAMAVVAWITLPVAIYISRRIRGETKAKSGAR